jgi:hypothetical protein
MGKVPPINLALMHLVFYFFLTIRMELTTAFLLGFCFIFFFLKTVRIYLRIIAHKKHWQYKKNFVLMIETL